MEIFDRYMPAANQLSRKREDFHCSEEALLQVPEGTITEAGIRSNINIGILYLESWLRGNGAAAIHSLMEDAATAEISRTQIWQWLHYRAKLADGRVFDYGLYESLRDDEIEQIQQTVGSLQYQQGYYIQAICLFNEVGCQEKYESSSPFQRMILSFPIVSGKPVLNRLTAQQSWN